jgi:UDPglucose 6-dehydrogenase
MIKTIGIIGQGFVGNAVKIGMQEKFTVETYDIIAEKSTVNDLNQLYQISDLIFLCVPTPMKKTGECDTSIIDKLLNEINLLGSNKIIILKSTVPPGTCDFLQEKYKNIDLLFNPEFLTEANAVNDFINQDNIIIGGKNESALKIASNVFSTVFNTTPILETTLKTAEMVKYVANCFLSIKVAFANQIFDLCNSLGMDYNQVIEISKLDKRLGNTHWKVPGPDGDRGYGGHCFPKDMAAILYLANENRIDLSIIANTIEYNDKIRTNKDWEQMKGRAVSIEN